jgi:signal transduction histidine kinase
MHGFAEALQEDYGERLEATGKDYCRRIVRAAESVDALIQDLLEYSRLSRAAIELRPVDLADLVDQVLARLDAELRRRRAQVQVRRPLPAVLGHAATLLQVVTNLVANAIKFVHPELRPQVQIRAEESGSRVRLWVEDNGIGIAPDRHERIFQPFERLHGAEAYPGTGIGLAVVRKGTERMGGSAGVLSRPGEGSRFWIELNRAEAQR